MKTLRIVLAATLLSLAGCMTIGSLSYTSANGQTVSVGFQQRQQPSHDGKSIRGFAK